MSTQFPGPGPVPPENNPAIMPQFFQPSQFVISNLTLGFTTTVTTVGDNNYVLGQQCRLLIPSFFGTYELNEAQGYVLSIPAPNQVVLSINSVGFTPFVPSPAFGPTPAQIIAIGDVNSGLISTNGKLGSNNNFAPTVPGSFINISP